MKIGDEIGLWKEGIMGKILEGFILPLLLLIGMFLYIYLS